MKEIIYSTKDICDIFQIGRETLRHYERLGLISPKINPENGYREYVFGDVGAIIDILKYRSAGLSLSEVRKCMYDTDYPSIVERLYALGDDLDALIYKYRMVQKKLNRDVEYLSVAFDHLNEYFEISIDDLFFIPYTVDKKDTYYKTMQTAFQNSQFFSTAIRISKDDILNSEESFWDYGLVTEKQYADYLKIDKGSIIKSNTVFAEMIELVGDNRLCANDLSGYLVELKKRHPEAKGPIYSMLMARFNDMEKRHHRYIFVFTQI